ncbi:MAG: hypothetical protein P8P30_07945 [Rickettsiales bacterium]|nr:hypothetical protein [Rickettsiales bacterium]
MRAILTIITITLFCISATAQNFRWNGDSPTPNPYQKVLDKEVQPTTKAPLWDLKQNVNICSHCGQVIAKPTMARGLFSPWAKENLAPQGRWFVVFAGKSAPALEKLPVFVRGGTTVKGLDGLYRLTCFVANGESSEFLAACKAAGLNGVYVQ